MKPVNVFIRMYADEHTLFVDLRGQGHLHQNPINLIALVEAFYDAEQVLG